MGLLGRLRAYKSGWGEILGPLPAWMKSNGVTDFDTETLLSVEVAPGTRVDLIQSHSEGNWKLAADSWTESGTFQHGAAQIIGRRATPPILLRAEFVKACLTALEDFERHYEGSADVAEVFRRIHEIRSSGLL